MLGQGLLGFLVEAEDALEVADIALEDGDVVGDERERIVDLVRNAGDHLAHGRERLRLDELALGPLQLLVRSWSSWCAWDRGGGLEPAGDCCNCRFRSSSNSLA